MLRVAENNYRIKDFHLPRDLSSTLTDFRLPSVKKADWVQAPEGAVRSILKIARKNFHLVTGFHGYAGSLPLVSNSLIH